MHASSLTLGDWLSRESGADERHAGFGQLVNFVTTGDDERKVRQPDKRSGIQGAAVSQFPAHPQYFEAGTLYFVALRDPLEFGNKSRAPKCASSLVLASSDGSPVCPRLITGPEVCCGIERKERTCKRLFPALRWRR